MLELVLSVCINGDPALCMDRHMPFHEPVGIMRCLREGQTRAGIWLQSHPDLELKRWRCDEVGRAEKAEPRPFETAEIAHGVHVHIGLHETPAPGNEGDLANVGFIVGEEAVAVIDAGGTREVGERLHAAIRRVTQLPIRWLILTHMHPDHILGAEVFREAGATVIGHAKLKRAVEARADTYVANIRRLVGERAFSGTRIVLPDEGVEDLREIDLGGRVLELLAHPTAHTDNDLSVYDRQTGTWWVSDLVFAEHTPALDGSIRGWIGVLLEMRAQPAERIVPGHGPASLPWPEGSDATLRYLEALAAETRAAIAAGETMNEAIRHLGESERENWQLFDEFNPRNASAAFQELEWE